MTHPERLLTVHLSDPAPFVPGVELVAGEATTSETVDTVIALLAGSGAVLRRLQCPSRLYVLPSVGAFLMMRALTAAHPGPTAAGTVVGAVVGADPGLVVVVALPVILAGSLAALACRVAQGSATVAATTAGSVRAPAVASLDTSGTAPASVVHVIAF